ncbi:MAG TPA: hypothetical protein PK760_06860 [Flavobacteriales bacterium]|nr:hypothetical protein [Flavobacteriales bacterium]
MRRGLLVAIVLSCGIVSAMAQNKWLSYFMVRFEPFVRTRVTDVNELAGSDSVLYAPIDSSRLRSLGVELGIKGGRHQVSVSWFGSSEALVGNSNFRYTYSYLPQGSLVQVNDTLNVTINMSHFRLAYGYGTNTRKTNTLIGAFIGLDHITGRLLVADSAFAAYVQAVNSGRQPGTAYNDLNQYRTDLYGITVGGNIGLATMKTWEFQMFFTLTPTFSWNYRIDTLVDGSKHDKGFRSSVGLSLGIGFGGLWKRYQKGS